jgi:hypothetical protein
MFKDPIAQGLGPEPTLCSSLHLQQPLPNGVAMPSYWVVTLTPWSESASELYRPSDRRLPAKLVPTLADRGCHVVSMTDPYGRILGFLDRSRYFSIK